MLVLLSLFSPTIAANAESEFLLAAGNADLAAMPRYFDALEADAPELLRELHTAFDARFVTRSEVLQPDTGNAWIDALVAAFRAYWTEALMDRSRAGEALARLEDRLTALTASATDPLAGGASVFDSAVRRARAEGFGISLSTTPPLHDLVLWSDEERTHYRVDLTDGSETVEVVFIDGLISQGWRHFASLGLSTTSGWTSGDALYCVRWAYDTGSEFFRVSYLKHEARHFADFRLYPGLDEATMEYRAKLTELVYAGTTATDLLRRFAAGRNADGASAHARANDRVARDMYREVFGKALPEHLDAWSLLGPARINPAARRLLARQTASLQTAP